MRNVVGVIAVAAGMCGANSASAQSARVDYARDIQPMLAQTCYGCHGPAKFSAGLRVDSVQAIIKGGRSGPAIFPGKAADSLLVKKADKDDPTPHKGRVLTAEQVILLKAWINQGAQTAREKFGQEANPTIVEVDLSKLPPDLAREIMQALNKQRSAPK